MGYFDLWPVEAPVAENACEISNPGRVDEHQRGAEVYYSCLGANGSSIHGDVGDVGARTLLNLLAYLPVPLDW